MINLAVNGVACECGSQRLNPSGELELGAVCVCADCARAFRVAVALTPLRWSDVVEALARLPYDLHAFEWIRNGVPESRRETLPELPLARSGRFAAAERSAVVLCVTFLIVISLVIAKAVHS